MRFGLFEEGKKPKRKKSKILMHNEIETLKDSMAKVEKKVEELQEKLKHLTKNADDQNINDFVIKCSQCTVNLNCECNQPSNSSVPNGAANSCRPTFDTQESQAIQSSSFAWQPPEKGTRHFKYEPVLDLWEEVRMTCIATMLVYQNHSLEELRLADYCIANQSNHQKLYNLGLEKSSAKLTGTCQVQFKPTEEFEVENNFWKGVQEKHVAYQSITCMPQYIGKSLEELRLEDYNLFKMMKTPSSFESWKNELSFKSKLDNLLARKPTEQQPVFLDRPWFTWPILKTSAGANWNTVHAGTAGFPASCSTEPSTSQPDKKWAIQPETFISFTNCQQYKKSMKHEENEKPKNYDEYLRKIILALNTMNENIASINTKLSSMESNISDLTEKVSVCGSKLSAVDMFVMMEQLDKKWQSFKPLLTSLENTSLKNEGGATFGDNEEESFTREIKDKKSILTSSEGLEEKTLIAAPKKFYFLKSKASPEVADSGFSSNNSLNKKDGPAACSQDLNPSLKLKHLDISLPVSSYATTKKETMENPRKSLSFTDGTNKWNCKSKINQHSCRCLNSSNWITDKFSAFPEGLTVLSGSASSAPSSIGVCSSSIKNENNSFCMEKSSTNDEVAKTKNEASVENDNQSKLYSDITGNSCPSILPDPVKESTNTVEVWSSSIKKSISFTMKERDSINEVSKRISEVDLENICPAVESVQINLETSDGPSSSIENDYQHMPYSGKKCVVGGMDNFENVTMNNEHIKLGTELDEGGGSIEIKNKNREDSPCDSENEFVVIQSKDVDSCENNQKEEDESSSSFIKHFQACTNVTEYLEVKFGRHSFKDGEPFELGIETKPDSSLSESEIFQIVQSENKLSDETPVEDDSFSTFVSDVVAKSAEQQSSPLWSLKKKEKR